MTRVHFKALAAFAANNNLTELQILALSETLEVFNPNFDFGRFIKACSNE